MPRAPIFILMFGLPLILACTEYRPEPDLAGRTVKSHPMVASTVSVLATEPLAPGESSEVAGTVLDLQGEIIIGATVELTCTGQSVRRTTLTNVEGRFSFEVTPDSSPCTLRFSYSGMPDALLEGLPIPSGTRVLLTAAMGDTGMTVFPYQNDGLLDSSDCGSGAKITPDIHTGEPSVHPY